jgi:hypothetical protein
MHSRGYQIYWRHIRECLQLYVALIVYESEELVGMVRCIGESDAVHVNKEGGACCF